MVEHISRVSYKRKWAFHMKFIKHDFCGFNEFELSVKFVLSYDPRHEKTGFLPMRKLRRKSDVP